MRLDKKSSIKKCSLGLMEAFSPIRISRSVMDVDASFLPICRPNGFIQCLDLQEPGTEPQVGKGVVP